MITLPNIVLTETDASTNGLGGKTSASAGDFLALLSQALPDGLTGADGKPLTFADLKAGITTADASETSLAALLQGDKARAENPLAEILAGIDQHDPLASLGKLIGNGKPELTDKAIAQSDTALSDEDMAALSALFAMLPQQQPIPGRTIAAAPASAGQPAASVSASTRPTLAEALSARTSGAGNGKTGNTPSVDDVPFVLNAAAGDKLQADSSATSATSQHNLTPLAAVVSSARATSAQIATPVAPHIQAQLGTPEWQSSVSQHITLLSRQGQQSAELRLHPEDLGSVQIRLKLDDNQAQIQMVSAHSHVRSALEAALPVLRAQLAENGIQLGQSSISSESFTGQSQADQRQQQSGRSGGFAFAGHEDEVLSAPASLQATARGDNAVDIFA